MLLFTGTETHRVLTQAVHHVLMQAAHRVLMQAVHHVLMQAVHRVLMQAVHRVLMQVVHRVLMQAVHRVLVQVVHRVLKQAVQVDSLACGQAGSSRQAGSQASRRLERWRPPRRCPACPACLLTQRPAGRAHGLLLSSSLHTQRGDQLQHCLLHPTPQLLHHLSQHPLLRG